VSNFRDKKIEEVVERFKNKEKEEQVKNEIER